ncbi:hypothetical protein CUN59_04405 [Cuspidothrix issatschenkoi CHARLIE-1]|uniref:Uncharacterized protein n=1 Tax=Cuspidothrix issatschenkoi CHARLIE-1 TaxID=2052836 RepID=A0A2S6CXY6_9CYAN|nr:hypothetical protein CUN59_04405 [Cuspidothrix issatschenkoi CHARLIE-1]
MKGLISEHFLMFWRKNAHLAVLILIIKSIKSIKNLGSTVLVMLNNHSERGNREQGTGNREKRQYFVIMFKIMAYFLCIASFPKFFGLDFAY